MKTLLIALCLLSGCARFDRATLVTSTATLACDWAQTRKLASANWQYDREKNPLMGPTPTVQRVDGYFFTAAMINLVAWHLTPEKWRSVLPTAVTAVQTKVVVDNAPRTGWCRL